MKKLSLTLTIFIVFGLLFSAVANAQEFRELRRLNVYPLSDHPIETVQQLEELMDVNVGIVKMIIGDTSDFFRFCEQFRMGKPEKPEIREITVTPGSIIKKMSFKVRGIRKVREDYIWAGKEPFPAFEISIRGKNLLYVIIVPKPCGNISLLRVEKLQPASSKVEKPVEKLEVKKPEEKKEPKKLDLEGLKRLAEETRIPVPKKIHFMVGAGAEAVRECTGEYVRTEAGLRFSLSEKGSIITKFGLAFPVENKAKWNKIINFDVVYSYRISGFSVGGGFGLSTRAQEGKPHRGEFLLDLGWKGFFAEGRISANKLFKIFKVTLSYRIFF